MMANLTRKHLCVTLAFNFNTSRSLLPGVINNDGYYLRFSRACSSQGSSETRQVDKKYISPAMKAHMKRTEEYETFMRQQVKEFNRGKHFLARIMGLQLRDLTQKKINEAIEYLFPSGLFHKWARPIMVDPYKIFEAQKKAHIDNTGRPLHYLFYTSKPQYSELMHEFGQTLEDLNEKLLRQALDKDVKPVEVETLEWVTKEELEKMLSEKILDIEYGQFVASLNSIVRHPYSSDVSQLIEKYLHASTAKKFSYIPPTVVKKKKGVTIVTVKRCKKKKCYGTVSVSHPGDGMIKINGRDFIRFFPEYRSRMQVLSPLVITKMLGSVNVVATVDESGHTNQAMVLRTGISFALTKLVPPEMKAKLKLAGFLERDPRIKERKKAGQKGARAKYTWLKR